MRPTPEATIGPFYPAAFVAQMPDDLWTVSPLVAHHPQGQRIVWHARFVDVHGRAVPSLIVEVWQANAHGRYRHPADRSTRPLDPQFDYALSFPKRLRSVVVANSIGGVIDEEYVELGRRIRPPAFNALPADVRELGPSYRAANPDGTKRWAELERTNRPAGEPPPAQTMKNRITFALLQTIDVPTLLLTGGADLYARPPVMQLFAARIKRAESVVVPEAGHSTYWEQPDVFNRTVLAFIRKH